MKKINCVISERSIFMNKDTSSLDIVKSKRRLFLKIKKTIKEQFPNIDLTIEVGEYPLIAIDNVTVSPASGTINGIIDQIIDKGTWLAYKK